MDFNMADMFGKIAEMQQQMQQTQAELAKQSVTAEVGGGLVTVTANGTQRITAIKIDPTAIAPDDAEMLEDLIVAGVNKALEDAAGLAQSAMQKQAGSMLPPGMDLSKLGF